MEKRCPDVLRLDNQLCFPLYACSREVIRRYKPVLDEIDLTYTQYIAMLVLWECRSVTAKELGSRLYLDSGTLTPLLKKLEEKGLVTRRRSDQDERNLIVTITEAGDAMKDAALHIPAEMTRCINLSRENIRDLYRLLYQMLEFVK